MSLTRQVLENYEKLGPQKAWTGPLARGDFGVVCAHERALQQLAPEFLGAYRAVSRLSARVLSPAPDETLGQLNTIFEIAALTAGAKGGYE
jgi:predicted short-subunit dehydrogenase-like oxidoreductase (DUF2520 family)